MTTHSDRRYVDPDEPPGCDVCKGDPSGPPDNLGMNTCDYCGFRTYDGDFVADEVAWLNDQLARGRDVMF